MISLFFTWFVLNFEYVLYLVKTRNVTTANDSANYQNWTWVYFKTSPPISTCLVAFFIGDYERVNDNQQNLINVYSYLGSLYQVEYVTREMPDLLKVIEEYTNVSFPMDKLDILTVPELGLGAMENWGLNFYRYECINNLIQKSRTLISYVFD